MKRCEDCIHKNVCLHKANIQSDTYAYMGVNYDTESCEHFKPTADVVPKSEVEALEREIERLKKSMLPSYYSACSEEEAIKIGKQYGRTEVAREIFAELETKAPWFCENQTAYEHFNEELTELKKKYAEEK